MLTELDAYLAANPASDPVADEAAEALVSDVRLQAITEVAVREALSAEAEATPELAAALEAAELQTRDRVLLHVMKERSGWSQPELSREELLEYYESHPEFYDQPPLARLQHIYLRAEKAVMSAAERESVSDRLEAIRHEALEGADFAALARQHSESSTAATGGFMSIRRDSPVPRSFAEAVWDLEVSGVSEVVDTGNGFHVIQLNQITEPVRSSFEESQEHLQRKAGQAKVEALQQQLIEEVGPEYSLKRHYERLSQDPDSGETVVLIEHQDGAYTLDDLLLEIPESMQEQIFQGYLPQIHRFLDQVAAYRLLILEGRAANLEKEPEIARRIEASVEGQRYELALQRRLDQAASTIDEDELREFFDQNEKRYETLRTYDLTVIHLARERGESYWQTLKRGEALVARIRDGEDMESLARKHSRHYSAAAGGQLQFFTDNGVRTRVQATAKFRRRLDALSPGEVSDAFLSEYYDQARLQYQPSGVLIVRLDAVHEPVPQTFDDVPDLVLQNYLRRHHRRLVQEVHQQVAEEIGLEIFADRLPPI